ncbi:alpha-glucoside-specific PTS transporter subunit IIBC [Sporolactobacillus terrae]|uniref:alpha-glucoside-specific PTS transporter subunit IIBC n=1 Tax=Sporolactobacillus terrae TaxID=269673 RepID=UPI000685C9AB|nr:alpha-glucoside-specific PTS transporter subunit IIBC [Sporolactobacillus terrae]
MKKDHFRQYGGNVLQNFQKFGGSMFTPVLLFTFPGILVALVGVFQNPMIMGSLANESTTWYKFWGIVGNGGWTVFRNMELLFVIGLPIGLAKRAQARAVMESFVTYLAYNYFISGILDAFGSNFGVDYTADPGGTSGLKLIAGIKTLDTNIIGSLAIAGIVVWLHNRYYEKKLPKWLSVFQGAALVSIIGFITVLPLAYLTCLIWPSVQGGIGSLQHFFISSGNIGIFVYSFLQRVLIPTGLHHFIYTPFTLGPAVVENGILVNWLGNLTAFSQSTEPLKTLFPAGGFTLYGMIKMVAPPAITYAFYKTANPEKRKQVLAIMLPAMITAVVAGITEPFEFTFLFIAPFLFVVYALLGALLATVLYMFGVTGEFTSGLLTNATRNWIPLWNNHWQEFLIQFIICLIFIVIFYFTFKILILKFNLPTPGRSSEEVKLYTKKDYKTKKQAETGNAYLLQAEGYLEALGGVGNITDITNCATRLRLRVKDAGLIAADQVFKQIGAAGIVKNGSAIQIIVGLSVPYVREEFEGLVNKKLNS